MARAQVTIKVSASVKTLEVWRSDPIIEEGEPALFRIEILKIEGRKPQYRARGFRAETFRIQPSHPQDPKTGEPAHEPCDELVLVKDQCFDWDSIHATTLKGIEQKIRSTLIETRPKHYPNPPHA